MNPTLYRIPSSSPARIAISARPRGGDWLEDEVEGWRKQGIEIVVSLLTSSENDELELKREASLARAKGIRFVSFPIEDRGVPQSAAKVEQLIGELGSAILQGKNIAVHCRQGIGRSSLISAALLTSAGDDLDQALAAISEARGLAVPETAEQRAWLDGFAKAHQSGSLARSTR